MHSDWPKLHRVLAVRGAIGLKCQDSKQQNLHLQNSKKNILLKLYYTVYLISIQGQVALTPHNTMSLGFAISIMGNNFCEFLFAFPDNKTLLK